MKPRRPLVIVAALLTLLVGLFLGANFWVGGGGSSATVEEVARSRCIQEGLPAKNLVLLGCTVDDMNLFGFGGRALIEFRCRPGFGPDGKKEMEPLLLRVELRRQMNLMNWEVLHVSKEP